MRTRLAVISLLCLVLTTSGCGSLLCHFGKSGKYLNCEFDDGIYRATRHDVVNTYNAPDMFFLFIFDLPFALVIDTLLLPYDSVVFIKDKFEESKSRTAEENKFALTLAAMNKVPFSCPDGAMPKINKWSTLSYSRYCVSEKLKDGPWEVWRSQYLEIKGSYKRGFKHGEWIWFNEDGSIFQKALYYEGDIFSFVQQTSKGWEPVPHLKNDRPKKPETED